MAASTPPPTPVADVPATPPATPTLAPAGAQAVMRRIILFALLFTVVTIGAIGIAGLLDRALDTGRVLVDDTGGLARALAFTLIGVPLAALLWWFQRRRVVREHSERASLVWTLYLAAMTLTALITATVSLGSLAVAGLDGRWEPGQLATGVVWAGVWLWHLYLRRDRAIAPTRLGALPVQLSAVFGLAVGASGAISALSALLSAALAGGTFPVLVASQFWVVAVLQGVVWCVLGGAIWWWHWRGEAARDARGAFAAVLLVIIVAASAATALFAFGTVLYVVLRLLFGGDPLVDVLEPLDTAIATALIGGLLWAHLGSVLVTRNVEVRRAGRLAISGIALIGAASGFGVVVNTLLATVSPALFGDDPRTLVFGGLSALIVGAPAWWVAWRPAHRVTATDAAAAARRVYLVIVFGASAIVALVTLLLIGYRLFEVLLDGSASSLIERIRAPFGLLAATSLVFGYHFAIWRRDRRLAPPVVRQQTIGRVILVTGTDGGALAARIREVTGAPVTVWRSAEVPAVGAASQHGAISDADADATLRALDGVVAPRVLVVALSGEPARVVPLRE